jgi:hypothetical protein
MAGEQKGIAYEALTKLILDDLKKSGYFTGMIFWEERPEGMTINPDLTIGNDPNSPHTLILISHGGSAKESNRKYWRNCGELVEAKLFLPKAPKVVSLFFDAIIKPEIKKVAAETFDGELIVGDRPYGEELQSWIDANLIRFPKDRDKKVEFLRESMRADSKLRKLYEQLRKDLEALLTSKISRHLKVLWSHERKRKRALSPVRKETYVRRGLSKLLIFEDIDLGLRLYSGIRVNQNELPAYVYDLGLASKAIGRAQPTDTEILNAVSTVGVHKARKVLMGAPVEMLEGCLTNLRNAPHFNLISQYVVDEFNELCDAEKLKKALRLLHEKPESLVEKYEIPPNWPPKSVWLFDFILQLLKHSGGNANSYGYAQMARRIEKDPGMPPARNRIYTIVLSDWLLRRDKEALPCSVLGSYAKLLSADLGEIGRCGVKELIQTLKESLFTNLIEVKLCTYRGFDPLGDLVSQIIPAVRVKRIQACFAEKALGGGQGGKTTLLQSKSTLINCQSCSDAGRDHKKKELCGRAAALRYSWDPVSEEFIPRPGIKKLILLLDGTWRQGDLDTLIRAGWDEIFYPDEIDELAKAIV